MGSFPEKGLEIMASQWTMSGLIGELTGQPFAHIENEINQNFHAVQLFQLLPVCSESLCIAEL